MQRDGVQLLEKLTTAKLDMLHVKSLYVLALNMVRSQRLDESSVADVHKQYGDHLYIKADNDRAMVQFVDTVGWMQPSYVIRKVVQVIHCLFVMYDVTATFMNMRNCFFFRAHCGAMGIFLNWENYFWSLHMFALCAFLYVEWVLPTLTFAVLIIHNDELTLKLTN